MTGVQTCALPISSFPVGTTTVTATATDPSNNTDVCSFTVTVTDDEDPIANCLPSGFLPLDANGMAMTTDQIWNDGSTDNCGILSYSPDITAFDCNDIALSPITVTTTVTDIHGNSSSCTSQVYIFDDIDPTITSCPVPVNPYLPVDNECYATLEFEATAMDNCSATIQYFVDGDEIFFPYNFPAGETTTVTVTATDPSGNSVDCTFDVAVNACTFITGKLIWEGDRLGAMSGVNNGVVTLSGDDIDTYTTGVSMPALPDGEYKLFADMGSNYTITPVKNRPMPGAISGLTSADAARIQQHVNGIFKINDPYKLIAADANWSDPAPGCPTPTSAITIADANWVQQAVLGNPVVRAWFELHTWRFVDKAWTFADPKDPWSPCAAPYFPETITLTGGAVNQDFIGVKLGDVNSTAAPLSAPGLSPDLLYKVQDRVLEQGATFTTEFNAYNFDDLLALQFGLQFDQTKIKFLGVETISGSPIQAGNFGLYDIAKGEIRAFLAMPQSKTLSNGTEGGFRLKFQVLQGGNKLSEVLHLSDEVLLGEAYSSSYKPGPVSLEFESIATGTIEPGNANLSLLQNVPNPFRTVTSIGFVLPETCEAQIRVFDISGRLVEEQSGTFTRGFNQLEFRLDGYAGEGVLYYELITPYGKLSKKMVLVRE